MHVRIERRPKNRAATALVLDLRNSTKLYRQLSRKTQREIIVDMMSGIHSEVMKYLYKGSGLNEDLFEYNDTGDGYLIVFLDETHSFSCVLCACHLREFLAKHLRKFNHKLCLDESSLRYSFGIGLHRSTVRVMSLKAKTPNGNSLNKKIIIGNAANSAGRVESITKNFLDIDLLITGYDWGQILNCELSVTVYV